MFNELYNQKVAEWIEENFELSKVTVEDYDTVPYGKKVIDKSLDYVVVSYDGQRNRITYMFK